MELKIYPGNIAILGMPHDENSSFLRGPAKAPELIRAMRQSDSANAFTEAGIDLAGHPRLVEFGDVTWSNETVAFTELRRAIDHICSAGAYPLTFGGDHAITFPIIEALSQHHPDITILHFDAHPDLYDSMDDNPLSHASPFARIMERGLVKRLIQIGIRTLNTHQRSQVERFGVECIEMKSWQGPEQVKLLGPVYLSFDMDALDPAFAPGVSHFEPGGFSTRQVLDVIQRIEAPIVGADIVEYNPDRDINGMTAMVATKLFKEICGQMLANSRLS